ncbi:M4 family metallopeptidase [Streptomyces sp. NPDC002952]|uniref:M4 family metallopeptidase n=1 Tax=Streptomyces sp. NPDC002952 TaxID=3364673 RepID=UPI0036CDB93F
MRQTTGLLVAVVACGSLHALPASAADAGPEKPASAADEAALSTDAENTALAALAGRPQQARTSEAERLTPLSVVLGPDGGRTVRVGRVYRGVPVIGGGIVVQLGQDGGFESAESSLTAPLALSTVPAVDAVTALAAAVERFGRPNSGARMPSLAVDAAALGGGQNRAPHLVWDVVVRGTQSGEGDTHVLVNATTGKADRMWGEEQTFAGTGHGVTSGPVAVNNLSAGSGLYHLADVRTWANSPCNKDKRSCGTAQLLTSTDTDWGNGANTDPQSAAVDAQYAADRWYSYMNGRLGRMGIWDSARKAMVNVHYDHAWANASWRMAQEEVFVGDGADDARSYASEDIIGHEMTHGLVSQTAALVRGGESEGLNEATADVFGAMSEFTADNPWDNGDYLIGEKVLGAYGRDMRDPASVDIRYFDCWTPTAWAADPHDSATIADHFFYLLAEGSKGSIWGNSPTCNGVEVSKIGRDKAAAIWFRALTTYMAEDETFHRFRTSTLWAATDLYGECSAEYKAVQRAWTAVNVIHQIGEDAKCDTAPPVNYKESTTVTAIPQKGTVYSGALSVSGAPQPKSPNVYVTTTIEHTFRGDLKVELIAPNGTTAVLKNPEPGQSADNLFATFRSFGFPLTMNRNGTWILRVTDTVDGDAGTIRGWTLHFE